MSLDPAEPQVPPLPTHPSFTNPWTLRPIPALHTPIPDEIEGIVSMIESFHLPSRYHLHAGGKRSSMSGSSAEGTSHLNGPLLRHDATATEREVLIGHKNEIRETAVACPSTTVHSTIIGTASTQAGLATVQAHAAGVASPAALGREANSECGSRPCPIAPVVHRSSTRLSHSQGDENGDSDGGATEVSRPPFDTLLAPRKRLRSRIRSKTSKHKASRKNECLNARSALTS